MIKTYRTLPCELCSTAIWLPEREKSRFIQISIHSTSVKNVVKNELLKECPVNKRQLEFPYIFCGYLSGRTKSKCRRKKWPVGQTYGAKFENCSINFQIVNCPVIKIASRTETSHKHLIFLKEAISFLLYGLPNEMLWILSHLLDSSWNWLKMVIIVSLSIWPHYYNQDMSINKKLSPFHGRGHFGLLTTHRCAWFISYC